MTSPSSLDVVITPPDPSRIGPPTLEFRGLVTGELSASPTLAVNADLAGHVVPCLVDPPGVGPRTFVCGFDGLTLPPGEHTAVVVAHAAHTVAAARLAITDDLHPTGGMHGSLDMPFDDSSITGDVLELRGWCLFDHAATSHVEVFVDGRSVGRARTYLDRSDLVAGSTHRDAPVGGFQSYVPVRDLDLSATVLVHVEAVSTDGRRWRSPSRRARRGASADGHEQVAYADTLRERTARVLDRMGTGTGTTVAVVTHDLGYGGGQLWLSEMLRQFTLAAAFDTHVFSIADGPLRSDLEELGIPVHVTASPGVSSLRAHEDRVRELATMFVSSGAGAVLVNTVIPFQAVEAAHLAGIPVVWAIHESFDLDVYCAIVWGAAIDPAVRQRFAASFRYAAALVFEAPQTADLFARLSSHEQRRILDYGVDVDEIDRYRAALDRPRVRAQYGWDDEALVIVVVGVFEGRKAQAATIAAFDIVADLHPYVHLALVGMHNSGYCNAVAEQATRARHGDRIHIEPITPDIHRWYAIADVLLCASDVESLPRSILEAMAFELPVVSTDVFGVGTLLDDGLSGWLTRSADLRGLATAIDRVVRLSPDERAAVATQARAEVARRSGEQSYGLVLARTLTKFLARDDDPLELLPPHRPPHERMSA